MKKLFIALLFSFTCFFGFSQDTANVLRDTVPMTLLFSYCSFCNPMTDNGFAVVDLQRAADGKTKVDVAGYLDKFGKPFPESAIIWMVHKKAEKPKESK